MDNKVRVKVAAYLMVGAVSLVMFVYGVTLPSSAMRIISALPLVIVVLFFIFDKWAWRWPVFLKFVQRPWIGGTWAGELTSYRRDGAGNPIESVHDAVLRIDQSFVGISLIMMTKESKSRSRASTIITNERSDYSIYYQYDNTPGLPYRDRSARHWGGVMFDVHGAEPSQIEAEYWTNRDTKGTFTMKLLTRSLTVSFDEAQALMVNSEGGE